MTAEDSRIDPLFENSATTFLVNLDGPSKPKEVILHHEGKFKNSDNQKGIENSGGNGKNL